MAEGLLTPQQQQDIDFNLLKNKKLSLMDEAISEDLTDMPDLSGNATKHLVVNATATGYELNDLPFSYSKFYHGIMDFSSSATTDVDVGFTPKFVVISGAVAGAETTWSHGTVTNLDTTPTYAYNCVGYTTSNFAQNGTDLAWLLQVGTSDKHEGTLSLNGTTISFTNTKSSSPGNAQISYFVIG